MDEPEQLEKASRDYRAYLMELGIALSALHDLPSKQAERNRRKQTAYDATLKRIDRSLEGV